MNSTSSLRHRSTARHKPPDRKRNAPKEEKATEADSSANLLFVITIDAATAQIVKLETVDGGGGRRELSQEEKAALVPDGNEDRIEEVLERAFEAGIACALGEEPGGTRIEETDETAEDAELRHLLLARLIEHSGIQHLMKSEVLNRAIFGTLIGSARAAAGHGTTPAPQGRAASAHTN